MSKKSTNTVCILRHASDSDVRVMREIRALIESGLRVDLICLRDEGKPRREERGNLLITRLMGTGVRGSSIAYVIRYGMSVLLMFLILSWRSLRGPYACVQVNTMPDALVFATIVARLRGSRILLDMHEPMPELFATMLKLKHLPAIQKLVLAGLVVMERWAIRYAHRVITVNDTIRQRFIERGADGGKIEIVRNVPDEEFFSDTPPKTARRGFVLAIHGSILPRYGHDTIIRALPLLRDQIEGLELYILGWGETEGNLRNLATQLEVADLVTFAGSVPFDQVAGRLTRADIGLVTLKPSPFSDLCQPNKLFEFVGLRKPVVASRLRAIEEVFDDTCLTFFEAGNVNALAQAILDVYRSPEKAAAKVEVACQRFQKLRWAATKDDYVNLVKDMLRR